jgi:hypothetical protein
MLPIIRNYARGAFVHSNPEAKLDLIQEVIANAMVAYVRLFQLGKIELAYPTVLARYAIAQVCDGRKVGNRLNIRDVSSAYCQAKKGIVVERLDKYDSAAGEWEEVVVEDRHTTPADVARVRIDFSEWLRSLPRRNRRITEFLALGNRTSDAAKKFRVSAGRISQVRRELQTSWQTFQGEPTGDNATVATA